MSARRICDKAAERRLHGGRALDDPAQKRRPTKERQARRRQSGGVAPRRAADRSLGTGCGPRGDARSDPDPFGGGEGGSHRPSTTECISAASRTIYPNGRKAWTKAHRGWLADQSFGQPAQQIALDESIEAVRVGEQRRDRVDGYLRAQIPTWSLFPLVQNLCTLRGLDTIASAGLAAAIGDPSRFASAPDFMAYLGLVPSEHTSGAKRRMGGITKSGNIHARTLLIEAAHSYRFPARITRRKLAAVDAVPEAVREIAWKAQTCLCQHYRYMMAKGKPTPVSRRPSSSPRSHANWLGSCGPLPASRRIPLRRPRPPRQRRTRFVRQSQQASAGRSHALRRQPLKATGCPEPTAAPIALRYVTVDRPCPEAEKTKVSTPASHTRQSAAASAEGSAG
jgi:transposase